MYFRSTSLALSFALVACVGDSPSTPPVDAGPGDTSVDAGLDSSVPDTANPVATLTLTPPAPYVLRPGGSLDVKVDFTRNGLTGPISMQATGAGAGTTVTIPTIADGTVTTTMKIACAANATLGVSKITLSGAGVTSFTFSVLVAGASGAPDQTFDGDGTVLDTTVASGAFMAVTVQPDGKIVVVGADALPSGKWIVRRYNDDGSPDTAFNANVTGLPTAGVANAVQIDPATGRIVVVGGNGGDTYVYRFAPTGAPDNSFNGSGSAHTNAADNHFGSADVGRAFVIQPDSSIVVAGNTGSDGYVIRFLSDGTRDQAFKNYFTDDVGYTVASFSGIFATQTGFFVVGNEKSGGNAAPIAARMLSDGTKDLNFNTGSSTKSFVATAPGCNGNGAGMSQSGTVAILGVDGSGGGGTLCETRTTAAGTPVTLIYSGGGSVGQMGGATAASNDGMYVDGWFGGSQDRKGFVRRRLAAGGLDPTFGTGGEVFFEDTNPNLPDSFTIQFKGIATDAFGRILAVGQRVGASAPGPFIYRLYP